MLEPFKVFEALRAHMSILIVAQARDPSRVRIAAIFLETLLKFPVANLGELAGKPLS